MIEAPGTGRPQELDRPTSRWLAWHEAMSHGMLGREVRPLEVALSQPHPADGDLSGNPHRHRLECRVEEIDALVGDGPTPEAAIADLIDLYEAIEADAHHAVGSTQRAGNRSRTQVCHASGEQRRGDRVAGAPLDVAAFITEADSSARRVKPPEH
jgi:hypothetical protein